MTFDWDEANITHIARHDIRPEEAEQVMVNGPIDAGGAVRNGEERTLHLGETDTGRVLLVVATERDNKYRVVTARPARRQERVVFSKYKAVTDYEDPPDT